MEGCLTKNRLYVSSHLGEHSFLLKFFHAHSLDVAYVRRDTFKFKDRKESWPIYNLEYIYKDTTQFINLISLLLKKSMYIACDGSLACAPLSLTSSINIAFSSTLPRVAIDNNIPISYISCNLTDADS